MKTITKYILAGLVLGSTVGCKERMIEFNSDPNVVSVTKPEYLFTGATNSFDMQGRGAVMYKYAGVMQLMQYVSKYADGGGAYVDAVLPAERAPESYSDYYWQFYGKGGQGNNLISLIRDINKMDELGKARYADIRAIAQVVFAYQQWRILEQYGAMVYTEAFLAQLEAILEPKYDLGENIYKSIDATFKEAITVLAAEQNAGTVALGVNDFFFGYYNDKGTVTTVTNYAVQRANWLRFANMARLQMAWKLRAKESAFYETVLAEVLAVPNGFMTEIKQGSYYNYDYKRDNNPDDVDIISQQYAISNTLLSVLKVTSDPRLQYLARPNGVSSVNSFNYRVMAQLFPDSLTKYGEIMRDGNIFQGQVSNPRFQDLTPLPVGSETAKNPGFIGAFTKSFVLPNTSFPDSLVYIDPDGKKVRVCEKDKKEFTLAIQLASPAQGRYFVKGGGKDEKNGNTSISANVNSLRWDGPGVWASTGNADMIPMRRPIITYAHQCFMFAHLGLTVGGKSPEEWYKEGVKSAMIELRDDAVRFQIQVAVATDYPKFPGYNPDGKFAYTDADIDAYVAARVAAPGFNVTEDAINQAWIYFYQAPEHAYSWWKTTGLPKFAQHSTPAEVTANVTNAYLEVPYTSDLVRLGYPRRSCLPGNVTNPDNYADIKAQLQGQPMFGDWSFTTGRVWFDVE